MSHSIAPWLGLRYTASRRASPLVTLLSSISTMGLVLAVGLLIVVLSVMNGFDKELRERILGIVPHAAIYHVDGIEDWQTLRQQFEQHPKIDAVAPFVEAQGMLAVRNKVVPVGLFGIDPELEQQVSVLQNFVQDTIKLEQLNQPSAVMLGAAAAERLGVSVGDRVTFIAPKAQAFGAGNSVVVPDMASLQVAGIIKSNTLLDSTLAVVSMTTADTVLKREGKVDGLRIEVHELFDAPKISWQLVSSLPVGYYGRDWMRTHGNLYAAIQMSKQMVGMMLVIILAVAAFNVVSMLVMVVTDKQRDVAILRTMGATPTTIMSIFMIQGSLVGVLGTLGGIVLGVGLSTIVSKLADWLQDWLGIQLLKPEVYHVTYLPVDLRLSDVIWVSGAALFLSFISTVYPSWRATRVPPAEILRYE